MAPPRIHPFTPRPISPLPSARHRSYATLDEQSRLSGGPLPWTASLPLDNSGKTLFYDVSAQLQGPDGLIACSISIGGTVISSGTAVGDYNICSAQIGQNFDGSWSSE